VKGGKVFYQCTDGSAKAAEKGVDCAGGEKFEKDGKKFVKCADGSGALIVECKDV